tara:strand:+ start:228 stop:833 length:606 start_codon:yes stop_codon:yes gene_type:complete
MTGIIVPDGGNIGSASDTDAISISSSGAVTFSKDINPNNFVGMIASFAMATPPTGWLACDGSAVSKATYSALFTALGANAWGTDTTDNFYLPDLDGAFLRGTGTGTINSRNKAGPAVGSFQEDELQAHAHRLWGFTGTGTGGSDKLVATANTTPYGGQQITWMGGNPFGEMRDGGKAGAQPVRSNDETFPYNAGVKYCIKY